MKLLFLLIVFLIFYFKFLALYLCGCVHYFLALTLFVGDCDIIMIS